jgi:hypothetical protein
MQDKKIWNYLNETEEVIQTIGMNQDFFKIQKAQ